MATRIEDIQDQIYQMRTDGQEPNTVVMDNDSWKWVVRNLPYPIISDVGAPVKYLGLDVVISESVKWPEVVRLERFNPVWKA